jgi:hypothetical protein
MPAFYLPDRRKKRGTNVFLQIKSQYTGSYRPEAFPADERILLTGLRRPLTNCIIMHRIAAFGPGIAFNPFVLSKTPISSTMIN